MAVIGSGMPLGGNEAQDMEQYGGYCCSCGAALLVNDDGSFGRCPECFPEPPEGMLASDKKGEESKVG